MSALRMLRHPKVMVKLTVKVAGHAPVAVGITLGVNLRLLLPGAQGIPPAQTGTHMDSGEGCTLALAARLEQLQTARGPRMM